MKKLLFLSFILFITLTHNLFSQTNIRYNLAGYYPEQTKRLVVFGDQNLSTKNWTIKKDTATLLNGTLISSFVGKGSYSTKAYNYEVDFSAIHTEGEFIFEIEGVTPITLKILNDPYTFLIPEILSGIRARRSGSADAIVHKTSHLGDNSSPVFYRENNKNSTWVYDENEKHFNMVGGWYDAGDYIKFTLTNAYTCYFLLKSYEAMPDVLGAYRKYSTTDLNDLLDEAQHGLKFLSLTMPDNDNFIIQTAGYLDHTQGQRLPENDIENGSRECYSALSKTQMGLTAASLALGAAVFEKKGKSTDASLYLQKAKDIYSKAKSSTEPNAWWTGNNETFYADNSDNDNMGLAAIELFHATKDSSYFKDAESYYQKLGSAYWASWSNLNMSFYNSMLESTTAAEPKLMSELNYFQNSFMNSSGNIWKTPHQSTWATLYSYFSVANNALDYQINTADEAYTAMALNVINYTLGLNPWGVGFVATKKMPATITKSYAAIYRLQPTIFPAGEIAEGPTTATTQSQNEQWFSPKHDPTLWHKEFNTSNYTFFEEEGNFVCMETTISGLADGLYLFSLAGKLFAKDYNLSSKTEILREQTTINVYPNPFESNININCNGKFSGNIRTSTGILIRTFEGNNNLAQDLNLAQGIYYIEVKTTHKSEVFKLIKEN